MATVILVCPKCHNQDGYENNQLDMSKELTCSACGFSAIPTEFELAQRDEKKSRLFAKIILIILAGVVFVSVGLSLIVMLVWAAPVFVAVLIIYKLYERSKDKNPISRL